MIRMNWKKNKINVAIQVLPQDDGRLSYTLVDRVIEAIAGTGFTYTVCPFETVVECDYTDLPALLETVHNSAAVAGASGMITNLKIQVDFNKNVTIDDKMEKYR